MLEIILYYLSIIAYIILSFQVNAIVTLFGRCRLGSSARGLKRYIFRFWNSYNLFHYHLHDSVSPNLHPTEKSLEFWNSSIQMH